jgi:hypothetical protein
MCGVATRPSRHSIASAGPVASWVGSRGIWPSSDEPHPSGSLPTRSPVSCDFAAPSNAACRRTVVRGAGCRARSRAPWWGSVHRLWGRSWHSAVVSVFTHVTSGADASIRRAANVVLVLAGCGVSDILRGMSLDGLVAQVGQVLGDARSLYGGRAAGRWMVEYSGVECGPGRDCHGRGVVADWGGAASSTHLVASGGRVLALDNVIRGDGATGSGLGGAADASRSGRNGMTGVVYDSGAGWRRSRPVPIPRPVNVSWWIICSRSWGVW